MIGKRILTVLGAMILGAGLIVSPAQAKCVKSCRHGILSTFHNCKKVQCPKGKSGKACRSACVQAKNASLTTCHAATPPACSPSGAFVD